MEVYNVEKSYVCPDVAVRISSWSNDDNRHVEIFQYPYVVYPIAAGLNGTVPYQSIFNSGNYLCRKA